MKILAVRIGDKYGPEYEKYLESKLPEHEFIWIREPINDKIQLQWNKMWGMQLDIDEPICVMDIDVVLVNDYKKLFDYPIKRGEFVSIPGWWRDTSGKRHKINGGFFKYYPKDCKYIYDKFMKQPVYWQRHYINIGISKGPVNGEQHFVEDAVREKLKLKLVPKSWVCRWCAKEDIGVKNFDLVEWKAKIQKRYFEETGNDYIYMGGEFHPDIKFVHFTHATNKPHDWEDIKEFYE